jgi:hypothetical protein
MHRHIFHTKCYGTFNDFNMAMLSFLRGWRAKELAHPL